MVFDAPYFDLASAPDVKGLVHWGAHDPGVARMARPEGLSEELRSRFGPYPAERYIYGHVWHDADATRAMLSSSAPVTAMRT